MSVHEVKNNYSIELDVWNHSGQLPAGRLAFTVSHNGDPKIIAPVDLLTGPDPWLLKLSPKEVQPFRDKVFAYIQECQGDKEKGIPPKDIGIRQQRLLIMTLTALGLPFDELPF